MYIENGIPEYLIKLILNTKNMQSWITYTLLYCNLIKYILLFRKQVINIEIKNNKGTL